MSHLLLFVYYCIIKIKTTIIEYYLLLGYEKNIDYRAIFKLGFFKKSRHTKEYCNTELLNKRDTGTQKNVILNKQYLQ